MTYMLVLLVHSWLRWVVLGMGIALLAMAFAGMRGGTPWLAKHEGIRKGFMHSLNLQFVLGLVLLFISPVTMAAFADMGAAMKDPGLRFFAVEHTATMLVAVAVAHIGMARGRKAANDSVRFRTTFKFQVAWLVLTFLAIPWPWLDVARPLLRGL